MISAGRVDDLSGRRNAKPSKLRHEAVNRPTYLAAVVQASEDNTQARHISRAAEKTGPGVSRSVIPIVSVVGLSEYPGSSMGEGAGQAQATMPPLDDAGLDMAGRGIGHAYCATRKHGSSVDDENGTDSNGSSICCTAVQPLNRRLQRRVQWRQA